MQEDYLVDLENSRIALVDVSEKALGPVKESILNLQKREAANIKDRLRKFTTRVLEFRSEFISASPNMITESSPEIIQQSYEKVIEYYNKTQTFETEARELNNLETLFDMQKSSYKALKDCRNELCNLKMMWDLISLIDYQFESWKTTLWDKIDTDELMKLIKEMQTK
jgi:dynein heavy chain